MPHASGVVSGRALERLRALDAREAAKTARAEDHKVRMARRLADSSAPAGGSWDTFLSLIDTSAGPGACHEWTGSRQWNHRDPNVERFEQGKFEIDGASTYYAHRLICMHEFKVGFIDPALDISPTCENHLCCNTLHLVARPHGSRDAASHREAVPVREYFCAEVAKQDRHKNLEQQADAILAA